MAMFYPFDSGTPAYPRIGIAQFWVLNVLSLTSGHVLF